MYHTYPYPHRKRSSNFLPFLILIIVGLTAVLAFDVFQYFLEKGRRLAENKAAVTIMKGRAEMHIWGSQSWVAAPTGSILREGDAIKTFSDSRASFALLNGSFLRADADTSFQLTHLRTRDGHDDLTINLSQGDIWIMKPKSENVKVVFMVETEDFSVTSTSTVFAVSKRDDFRVRVLSGKVEVNVKEKTEKGKVNIIETVPVAVGQEFIASSQTLQAFRERKSPEAILAFTDSFRGSEWYDWNMVQDRAVKPSTISVEEAAKEEKKLIPSQPVAQTPEVMGLPSPEILEPDTAHRTTTLSKLIVRGTTSDKTQKIIVKNYVGGKEDAYALQKYTPGSTRWNYLVDEALGNWVPGQNRFVILAVDAKGRESEPAELVLTYDKAKPAADLSAPVVSSFNGASSNETTDDSVKVEGKVGKGIVKVYVNDFALTRYVPNSEEWLYYSKTEYGNLKEGTNEYEVYGIDVDGRKTPKTKFTIVKNPKTPTEGSPLE